MQQEPENKLDEMITELAKYSKDPLLFVHWAFPWDEGELAKFGGPDAWQEDILRRIRDGIISSSEAIQIAVSSGHGIGKSALVSWIILWAISTKENTRGVVTANTDAQLKTKTWGELSKWYGLFIAKDLFKYNATSIFINSPIVDEQKSWRIDCVPWSEHNTEAFAGLHNQGKRILVLFDEASAIHDKIWDVTEGALTDDNTEIIWACFGNPTRNNGKFFNCFGRNKHRWTTRQIDSRTVKHTNKEQIQKWVDDNGENSDFVKIRVRGIFPSTSSRQFIPTEFVDMARGKSIGQGQHIFAPIIIGVDPAYSGDDESCIYMRQGLVSKKLGSYMKLQDDLILAGYVAKFEDEYKADAVFVDMGYGTGVVSAGRAMNRNWILVPFGGASSKQGFLNKRAEIWGDMKLWLKEGGCLEADEVVCSEITGPMFFVNLKGQIQLESKEDMKKRGLSSPNRADALALTFTYPVMKKAQLQKKEFTSQNYDPFK